MRSIKILSSSGVTAHDAQMQARKRQEYHGITPFYSRIIHFLEHNISPNKNNTCANQLYPWEQINVESSEQTIVLLYTEIKCMHYEFYRLQYRQVVEGKYTESEVIYTYLSTT